MIKILITLAMFCSVIVAETPSWVTSYGSNISTLDITTESYYIGFGMSEITFGSISDALDRAETAAQKDIASKIYQKIKSVSLNRVSETVSRIEASYSGVTSSQTHIQLQGTEKREYVDSESKKAFVLIFVSKENLQKLYSSKLDKCSKEIHFLMTSVVHYIRNNEKQKALETLSKLSVEIAKTDTLLGVTDYLLNPETFSFDLHTIKRFYQEKSDSLLNSSSTSVSELAFTICNDFTSTLHEKVIIPKVQVTNTGFGSERIVTPLSFYLANAIEDQLDKNFKAAIVNFSGKISEYADYIIIGEYIVTGDNLEFQMSLFEVETGLIVKKSNHSIPIETILKTRLNFLP